MLCVDRAFDAPLDLAYLRRIEKFFNTNSRYKIRVYRFAYFSYYAVQSFLNRYLFTHSKCVMCNVEIKNVTIQAYTGSTILNDH